MSVLITGATGQIGRKLTELLVSQKVPVRIVTRRTFRAHELFGDTVDVVEWHSRTEEFPADALEGVTNVVHLMGTPITGLQTKSSADQLHASHVVATEKLASAMATTHARLIATTSAGVYPAATAEQTTVDEGTALGEPQTAMQRFGQAKERAIYGVIQSGNPVIAVRLGHVFGRDGVPSGLVGQALGIPEGAQELTSRRFPVIALGDAVRALAWLLTRTDIEGPFNAVAPGQVTVGQLMRLSQALPDELQRKLKGAAQPAGFALFRKQASWKHRWDDITVDRPVHPALAMARGFNFSVPDGVQVVARALGVDANLLHTASALQPEELPNPVAPSSATQIRTQQHQAPPQSPAQYQHPSAAE